MGIKDTKPVYLQLADKLMDAIVSGMLAPDSRIPSVREFAASNQVNVNTAMRSFDYLTNKGIIYTKRGMGYFVEAQGPERVSSLRQEEFLMHDMDYFFRKLRSFDMTPEQLAKLYQDFLNL